MSASKAIAQGAPQASGGWGSSAAGMAQSMGQQSNGWSTAYGQPVPGLPRPHQTFTDGAFGPLTPILPVPIDVPEPDSDFVEPRLQEYQIGWNLPVGQPGSEGIKLADFSTLKTLADLYSVARACIQLRKSEVRGIEWDILPTRDASKAMRGSPSLAKSFGARRAEVVRFFKRPDPDFFNWASFLDALSEEVFVFDALSLLIRPKWARGHGHGLLGSDLDSLSLISGPTIRPLFGMHGERPRPPAPAYQQYLYGVPRVDLMSLITERDLMDGSLAGSEMSQFQADQLLYLPMVSRRWTPYGFPPIERALIPVMSGLQKQGYQLDYFREGSVPAVYVSPGGTNANMTPNQIRELQDALNAVAGDPAWKHKIIVLPADSKVMPQKQQQLADQFDEIVMNQVCMAFDVQPMELGISPKVSTTQSPGAANQMAKSSQDIHQRKATKPFLSFIADIMNVIIQEVCGQSDMRFMFEGLEEGEDEQIKTKILIDQVGSALRSIDEAREELDLQPWGLPETSDPGWATATGWTPLTEAIAAARTGQEEGSVFVSPETGMPVSQGGPAAVGAGADSMAGAGVSDDTTPVPGSPQAPSSPDTASPTGGLEVPDPSAVAAPATPGHAAAVAGVDNVAEVPTQTAKARKDGPHQEFQNRRAKRVEKNSDKVESNLTELIEALRDGKMDRNKGVALGVAFLTAGYKTVMDKAVSDAEDDHGLEYSGSENDQSAWALGEKQRQWLDGLVQKALADPDKKLKGRIGLYADTLHAAYNKAYAEAAKASGESWNVTWHLGEADHCQPCLDLDGRTFTLADLPGYPGDSGFGDVCEGGPRCKCSLEFTLAKTEDTKLRPHNDQGVSVLGPDGDIRERVAQLANARAQAGGSRPAQPVRPEDISDEEVAKVFASKTRAILSELEALARHVNKGRDVLTWEPRHLSSDVLARVNEFMAKGSDVNSAVQMVRQQRLVDSAGQVFWRDLIGDWRPGQIAEGRAGGYEKKPHDVEDRQMPLQSLGAPSTKAARDLDDHNPVASEHVMNMMLDKFPPKALKWVDDARWVGPVEIPLDRIDFDDEESWAASHEPDQVAKFVKILKKGKRLKPGISVRQMEGDSRIKVVDGHHRLLAYKALGQPFVSYLGFILEDDDRWEQTHSYQYTDDKNPSASATADKSDKVSKASVDYRRADEPGKSCGTCDMFVSPDGCTLVAGLIDARDVCDRWMAAKSDKAVHPAAVGDSPGEFGGHTPTPAPAVVPQAAPTPNSSMTGLAAEEQLMNDPTLIEFFEEGAGGAQIKWGTTGDIGRCVTLATQTLGLENSRAFCQIRYAKMTGQSSSGLVHQDPGGPGGGN